jgi:DNA-binding transcriptional regulator YdaS (Cro superfamily)
MRDPGLEIAIKAAGGVASLARGIGIAQPSVSAWSRIPAKRVLAVEALTQVDRFVLRPDLYGSYQNHMARPDADAMDRLRAEGYNSLPQLPRMAAEDDAQDRFETLYFHDFGLANVEHVSRTPESEQSRALEGKLREAIVAELKRQASMGPSALSIADSNGLVVNGTIDLARLVTVIAGVTFGQR